MEGQANSDYAPATFIILSTFYGFLSLSLVTSVIWFLYVNYASTGSSATPSEKDGLLYYYSHYMKHREPKMTSAVSIVTAANLAVISANLAYRAGDPLYSMDCGTVGNLNAATIFTIIAVALRRLVLLAFLGVRQEMSVHSPSPQHAKLKRSCWFRYSRLAKSRSLILAHALHYAVCIAVFAIAPLIYPSLRSRDIANESGQTVMCTSSSVLIVTSFTHVFALLYIALTVLRHTERDQYKIKAEIELQAGCVLIVCILSFVSVTRSPTQLLQGHLYLWIYAATHLMVWLGWMIALFLPHVLSKRDVRRGQSLILFPMEIEVDTGASANVHPRKPASSDIVISVRDAAPAPSRATATTSLAVPSVAPYRQQQQSQKRLTIETIVANTSLADIFVKFTQREFSSENFQFYQQTSEYKDMCGSLPANLLAAELAEPQSRRVTVSVGDTRNEASTAPHSTDAVIDLRNNATMEAAHLTSSVVKTRTAAVADGKKEEEESKPNASLLLMHPMIPLKLRDKAVHIYERHIAPGQALFEVNLPSAIIAKIVPVFEKIVTSARSRQAGAHSRQPVAMNQYQTPLYKQGATGSFFVPTTVPLSTLVHVFDAARKEIVALMMRDTVPRFIVSDIYLNWCKTHLTPR